MERGLGWFGLRGLREGGGLERRGLDVAGVVCCAHEEWYQCSTAAHTRRVLGVRCGIASGIGVCGGVECAIRAHERGAGRLRWVMEVFVKCTAPGVVCVCVCVCKRKIPWVVARGPYDQ